MRKLAVLGLLAFVIGMGIDLGANLGQLFGLLVGGSIGYMVLSAKYRKATLPPEKEEPPARPPAPVKLAKVPPIRSNGGSLEVSDDQVTEWLANNSQLKVESK